MANQTTTHPDDVHSVLESIPVESQPIVTQNESRRPQSLLDAIAKENNDDLAKHENSIFRGILTAMLWIGGATIAAALVFTLGAIFK